jgi:Lytic transglycolase
VLVVTFSSICALAPDLGTGTSAPATSAVGASQGASVGQLDPAALAAVTSLPDTGTLLSASASDIYQAPAPAIQTSVSQAPGPLLAPLDGPIPTAQLPLAPAPPASVSQTGFLGKVVNAWRYDPQISWYGPGFYGQRTACGYALTTSLVGVAHRTLPCGTIVQFRWNGVTVSAPVVDRGPYVSGRIFDMTYGLCAALGHCWTGPIEYRIP